MNKERRFTVPSASAAIQVRRTRAQVARRSVVLSAVHKQSPEVQHVDRPRLESGRATAQREKGKLSRSTCKHTQGGSSLCAVLLRAFKSVVLFVCQNMEDEKESVSHHEESLPRVVGLLHLLVHVKHLTPLWNYAPVPAIEREIKRTALT